MHRFKTSAPHARLRRSTNGATYAPDAAKSALQAVAIKDAVMAVKLIML